MFQKLRHAFGIIDKNFSFVCEFCLNIFPRPSLVRKHQNTRCPKLTGKTNHLYMITGFTLDNRTYVCHIGCNDFQTDNRKHMVKHLIERHTREELEKWKIPINCLKLI